MLVAVVGITVEFCGVCSFYSQNKQSTKCMLECTLDKREELQSTFGRTFDLLVLTVYLFQMPNRRIPQKLKVSLNRLMLACKFRVNYHNL